MPESFSPNEAVIAQAQEEAPKHRVFVESFGATRPVTLARDVDDDARKTSDVSEDIGGRDARAISDFSEEIGDLDLQATSKGLGGAK